MNLQQLEYILAVDRLKNFSRAAESCHVTQATLSAMVKKLEEELGVILFDRKTNPIITTDCGREIIDQARKVINEAEIMKQVALAAQGKIEGKLSLGIIPTIANSVLPLLLPRVIKSFPGLELSIEETPTDGILSKLREGSLDVGIVSTPLNREDIEESILYYEALVVYGEVEGNKTYLLPEEIKDHKIWMLEEGHCLREQFLHLCKLKPFQNMPDNLKFEANSFETLLNMVDAFGGLTLIPELYYKTLPDEKKAKVRFFHSPIPVREVSLVYYRPYAKHRLLKVLENELKEMFQNKLLADTYPKHELDITQI